MVTFGLAFSSWGRKGLDGIERKMQEAPRAFRTGRDDARGEIQFHEVFSFKFSVFSFGEGWVVWGVVGSGNGLSC